MLVMQEQKPAIEARRSAVVGGISPPLALLPLPRLAGDGQGAVLAIRIRGKYAVEARQVNPGAIRVDYVYVPNTANILSKLS